jgi:RNA polymerase sigma-70 factor (ECF subfamily)
LPIKYNNHIPDLQEISKIKFEEIFCIYYSQVAAFASVILEDKAAGEDIAQEVFVYVWEKRKNLQIGKGFRSYLFQSAYTRAIDYIKRSKQFDKYSHKIFLQFAEEYSVYLEDESEPLKKLFSKDFEKKLNALLDFMPEIRRESFKLIYRDGLKAREVAEILKIPQRTVESHVYLTLKFLRKELSPSDFIVLLLTFTFF